MSALCQSGNREPYSIASSAATIRPGETLKPTAFADLRFGCQLVLGWRLHRQVGRFLALEDAIDVTE
jgi:hypothetical protein